MDIGSMAFHTVHALLVFYAFRQIFPIRISGVYADSIISGVTVFLATCPYLSE
jgi:hypothetical protein